MMLRPSDIYFSQDSINNVFDKRCPHRFKTVGETLDDLCEGRISVNGIPTISVMNKGGKWFTGDNRRLWVFRQLERLGKCTAIRVDVTNYIPSNKFTTFNGGTSVTVRRNPGGKWYLRPSSSTNYTPSTERRSPSPVGIVPSSHRMESRPASILDHYRNLNASNRQIYPSPPALQPAKSAFSTSSQGYGISSVFNRNTVNRYSTGLQDIQRSVYSLNIRDDENTQYVDPMDCRYLKESIPSWFDNGQTYGSLKQSLLFGRVSYRDIKAVEVYEAYGVYYVCDGNRRLKAFQEAKARISDIKLKVKIIGDEDDLLDELRKEDPAITAFEAMQLGETVVVR